MKKNKKLMLAAIAAMGVAAMGVGGMSTFAWYQATARAGQAADKVVDSSISVNNPQYGAESVDLPLNVTVTRTDVGGDLELVHWYNANDLNGQKGVDGNPIASSAEGFYKAYYKTTETSSIVYSNVAATSHRFYAEYEIEVQVDFPAHDATGVADSEPSFGTTGYWKDGNNIVRYKDSNGNNWTEEQTIAELNGKSVKFSLGRASGSRAKFFDIAADDNSNETTADSTITPANGVDTKNSGSDTTKVLSNIGTAMKLGYFGLYVEGVRNDSNMDTGEVSGDFTVTVEKAA